MKRNKELRQSNMFIKKGANMTIYLLDKDGNPFMTTKHHEKVKRLIKINKAKQIKKNPQIVQLLYTSRKTEW